MENSSIFADDYLDKKNQSSQYQDPLLNSLVNSGGNDEEKKIADNVSTSSNVEEQSTLDVSGSEIDKGSSKSDYQTLTVLTHSIKGEDFYIEKEGGKVFLNHPKWSLVGVGKSLLEAEQDMLNDADLISKTYFNTVEENLSLEARRLKEFLYKIVV